MRFQETFVNIIISRHDHTHHSTAIPHSISLHIVTVFDITYICNRSLVKHITVSIMFVLVFGVCVSALCFCGVLVLLAVYSIYTIVR